MVKYLDHFQGKVLHTESMQEAVAFAFANTQAGQVCLLSTASPSYSLWKNFEEKGDLFQTAVKELGTSSLAQITE